jgi:hypothetical protein
MPHVGYSNWPQKILSPSLSSLTPTFNTHLPHSLLSLPVLSLPVSSLPLSERVYSPDTLSLSPSFPPLSPNPKPPSLLSPLGNPLCPISFLPSASTLFHSLRLSLSARRTPVTYSRWLSSLSFFGSHELRFRQGKLIRIRLEFRICSKIIKEREEVTAGLYRGGH